MEDETDGSITYVDEDETVYACYYGNNNISSKFETDNPDDYYWIKYKGTVSGATIIIPDYIEDKPVKKVNVDNLYNANPQYTSLTMPSTLEFIEYGTYKYVENNVNKETPISWIILAKSNDTHTFKLLKETAAGSSVYDETASNTYENSTIKSYIANCILLPNGSENLSLLSENDFNNYYDVISNEKYKLTYSWWLKDSEDFGTQSDPDVWASYVDRDQNYSLSSYEDAGEQANKKEFLVRPTITLTL